MLLKGGDGSAFSQSSYRPALLSFDILGSWKAHTWYIDYPPAVPGRSPVQLRVRERKAAGRGAAFTPGAGGSQPCSHLLKA